jgi:type I restriction enzyme R subunit
MNGSPIFTVMLQPPDRKIVSKPSEADACRKYVTPNLQAAGWDTEPHSLAEQRTFTAGRIVVAGTKAKRREAKRTDYLLRYTPDFTIAVVEAKAEDALPGDGLQQAKDYAEILGLKFAYSTNGLGIVEFDFITGQDPLSVAQSVCEVARNSGGSVVY